MASHARPRVLVLAADCNPEWPSLPVVGYKYALSLGAHADVTVATHVRNRENVERAYDGPIPFEFIDNEWIAAPLYRLATKLRGGKEVAWSTNQIMAYPPYVEFERQVWRRFGPALRAGEFDLVHRVTPMSPTLPSPMASWSPVPFVVGPLNGSLPWPPEYQEELEREREGLRRLRGLYRFLPFSRSTYRNAAAVLAAFSHTIADVAAADDAKIVSFPEIGFDEELFHPGEGGGASPDRKPDPVRFLFVGRLVPYKLPEAAVRAFAESPALRHHVLHVVGDGPERPRLEAIVERHGLRDRILIEGRKTQAEVAEFMRRCDVFVFPSIRELGAGVVIEAMASGMVVVVADYGAPGDLAAGGRGVRVPLTDREGMVRNLSEALERCVDEWPAHAERARAAQRYAFERFRWSRKGELTREIYDWLLGRRDKPVPYD